MASVLALVIGGLYATGIYMVLRRSLFKLVLGLVLLSHGANLLIFTSGGLTRAQPPIIPPQQQEAIDPSADPLPQALILTAIVISFGIVAFLIALLHRRNSLEAINESCTDRADDPFAMEMIDDLERVDDDYEWLEDVVLMDQLNKPRRSR